MIIEHPFLRYGKALTKVESRKSEITTVDCRNILKEQMEYYRLVPTETYEGKENVNFTFSNNECVDGKKTPYTKNYGIFLAPNVILEDGSANGTWVKLKAVDKEFEKKKDKNVEALLSISAVAGDYIRFSESGGKGKVVPKISYQDYLLLLTSLITDKKPSLQYYLGNSNPKNEIRYNACIIPDLEEKKLIDFIKLFKRMVKQKTENLFIGNVLPPGGTGANKRTKYEAKRPLIFKGNFPNPPRSSALGSIALLGAIGEFAKEAEVSDLAQSVLDSLKGATIYMIKYGDAQTFTYNHHVIDFAKEGNLRKMVDAIFYSKLYNQDRRTATNTEYQKFDLFSSRFLQLFNAPAFKDFLAFRAEYSHELELLFKTYFIKMENIKPEIVTSARFLGKWLNRVAYYAAKREIKEGSQNYHEKIREQKAKVLIELESAAFAAKSGDALIAQVVTRAGRLSGMDAPNESDVFMEATMNGELLLSQAQNLVIAFSRLKSYKTPENENPMQNNSGEKEELDLV